MSEQKKILTAEDFSDHSITEVVIGEDVECIEEAAFGNCHDLKTVYFNAVNCKTTGSGKINAFGRSGATCDYYDYTTSYANYTDVDTFIIGEKVKRLPKYIFSGTDITSITIPAGVEEIEDAAFCNVPLLKDIIVDPKNKTFAVENGILINKKIGKIICVPGKIKMSKVYTIPEDIKSISKYAFDNRGTNPMEIHFPKHVAVPNNARLKKRKIIIDGVSDVVDDGLHEIVDGKLISTKRIDADEHTLPATVKILGTESLKNSLIWKKLIVPQTVEKIETAAFSHVETKHLVILNPKVKCAPSFLKDAWVRLVTFYDSNKKKMVTVYLPNYVSTICKNRVITTLGASTSGGFKFDIDAYRNLTQIPKEEKFMFGFFANRDIDPDSINVRACIKAGLDEAFNEDLLTVDDFKVLYETENLTKTNIKFVIECAEKHNKTEIVAYLKTLKI